MNELIRITEKDGRQVCSARELYDFLEVETPFHKWIPRMLEYGFDENIDWTKMSSENQSYNIEYVLTLDCAKEISMLQRTEKGKEARQYFISCERKLKEVFSISQSMDNLLRDPDNVIKIFTAIKEERQLRELAENTIQIQAPKVLFADSVALSSDCCLVAELAKIICQNGVDIGEKRLFAWLREHNYLCSAEGYWNQPTQYTMNMGWFEIKKTTITTSSGRIIVNTTTKVTGKGQIYFVNKFLKNIPRSINPAIINNTKIYLQN